MDIAGHDLFTVNSYCGIVIVVLMVCYLLNAEITPGNRIRRCVILLFLAASLCVSGLIYVMHGFSYPHSISNRDAFLLTVFIIISAFEQVCKLKKLGIIRMSIVAIILMGLTICAFIWNNDVQNIICYMGTILILVYGLICLFLYERNSITGKSMLINVIVLLSST